MLTILGPTATGKTRLAALVASRLGGEIISADSRQVFRGMDLGTGKDLDDYIVNGNTIPYHLIDIAEAGEEYSVFRFRQDFQKAYQDILAHGKFPILCGGTGLYIESVLGNYRMAEVPENKPLREIMEQRSDEELTEWLASLKTLHSTTDTCDRQRLYRAIEIELFHQSQPEALFDLRGINSVIVGVRMEREKVRDRMTQRLQQRLENGMTDEVQRLLDSGVPQERLKAYGLEYKYITQYLSGELSYDEMFRLLNTAIQQFAKRQMTWFRRMERNGYLINWIDGSLSEQEKVDQVLGIVAV